ncbi:phosphoribosylanthranilate isomerase [Glutamicibacter sp.]|uniref:phosphoribosylanthranilate isomerase n=1 Tax=Glutamicibacter sp. TaxID=1931995 RepID=UPI0028BF276B|nr:phosphoribosylanthranilate isomerase [Glutamicibacter sp.]
MSAKPFVKVCGLSTEADVAVAVEHGADALGFVLTHSPREVSPQRAAELVAGVPENVATVAVFRSEPVEQAIALASEARVGWIQLHGKRTPEDVQAVKAAGFHAIRAVRMDAEASEFGDWGEDFLLIDAAVPGSGESWDYTAVRELAAGRRWLVAGGLSAQNVVEALAQSQASGADVSSGVESARGVKDPALIAAFVDEAKHGNAAAS